jgi:hypothetical protein
VITNRRKEITVAGQPERERYKLTTEALLTIEALLTNEALVNQSGNK